jgi:hypothetical protein
LESLPLHVSSALGCPRDKSVVQRRGKRLLVLLNVPARFELGPVIAGRKQVPVGVHRDHGAYSGLPLARFLFGDRINVV